LLKLPRVFVMKILGLHLLIWLVPIVPIIKFALQQKCVKVIFMDAKIGHLKVNIFKIKNRFGYAALCCDHLTEGKTPQEAYDRMIKALRRSSRKGIA